MTEAVITLEQIRLAMMAGGVQFAGVAVVADAFFEVVRALDALEEALDSEPLRAPTSGVSSR